jgi:hypothetical protein
MNLKLSILLSAALLSAAPAPGSAPDRGSVPDAPSASVAYPTLEALVEAAVAGLNGKDTAALVRMSCGREDFLRAYASFESDTSRSRREFACGYYLSDNRKILDRCLGRDGGESLEVSRIEAREASADGRGIGSNRRLKIWVVKDGREIELRFLKSAFRTDAGWKIWSFEDD